MPSDVCPRRRLSCLALASFFALGLASRESRAADADVLHVWLAADALDEAVARFLPASVPSAIAGPGLEVTALVSCGTAAPEKGSDKTKASGSVGRFLALVQTREARERDQAHEARHAFGLSDCKTSLATAASRVASAPAISDAALAEVWAVARGSSLKVSLHDVVAVRSQREAGAGGSKKSAAEPTSSLETLLRQGSDGGAKAGAAGASLADLSLKDLPLEVSPGRKLTVSGQAGFLPDGLEVALWLADRRANVVLGSESVRRTDMPAAANARFSLGWDLANEVMKRLEKTGPFLLETQQETLEVSRLSLAGNGAGAKARGNVRARSVREDFQLAVGFAEADLKVSDISVTPNLADCGALGLLQRVSCVSQNAARSAAASAAAGSLANRYQGRLVTQLLGAQNLRFDLEGLRVLLRLEPQSFMSASFGLLGTANAKVEPAP